MPTCDWGWASAIWIVRRDTAALCGSVVRALRANDWPVWRRCFVCAVFAAPGVYRDVGINQPLLLLLLTLQPDHLLRREQVCPAAVARAIDNKEIARGLRGLCEFDVLQLLAPAPRASEVTGRRIEWEFDAVEMVEKRLLAGSGSAESSSRPAGPAAAAGRRTPSRLRACVDAATGDAAIPGMFPARAGGGLLVRGRFVWNASCLEALPVCDRPDVPSPGLAGRLLALPPATAGGGAEPRQFAAG